MKKNGDKIERERKKEEKQNKIRDKEREKRKGGEAEEHTDKQNKDYMKKRCMFYINETQITSK